MTKILTKLRIDEVSAVDRGAGEGVNIVLRKHDHDGTPIAFGSREQALQAIADRETAEAMAKANSGGRSSEYQEYRKRLFSSKPAAPTPPATVPVNKAYQRLEELAKAEAAKHPGMTESQAFLLVAEANPNLFKAAKARPGSTDVDPEDDDPDVDETDDDPDDDPPGQHDGIGIPPFEGASGDGEGRSQGGPYDNSGSNVRQHPKDAVVGNTEGSYNPKARPASATRKVDGETVWRDAVAKRFAKFLAKRPGGTPEEAMRYAKSGRKVRRAYDAWLSGSAA